MKYVLITPAHNEEDLIEGTILSVIAQTVRPIKWVIVNDGSTDQTRHIIEKYHVQYQFIQLLNIERATGRSFGSKALAFNRAVEQLSSVKYDFIGNLDADITVAPSYFENIVTDFNNDSRLGISGGIVYSRIGEISETTDTNHESVGGAVQLFRRECFEEIGGGYAPLPFGGIDAAAELTAKMKGWKVRKSLENRANQQRSTNIVGTTPLVACYRMGGRFHSLGYGFPSYSLRCLYRICDSPVVIGSAASLLGFIASVLARRPVVLPQPVVTYWKRERRSRLLRILFKYQ